MVEFKPPFHPDTLDPKKWEAIVIKFIENNKLNKKHIPYLGKDNVTLGALSNYLPISRDKIRTRMDKMVKKLGTFEKRTDPGKNTYYLRLNNE